MISIRINRILLNLLNNAIKFTPKGEISISASIEHPKDSGHIILQLTISDTGIGIPQDRINDIFDDFVRLSASYKGIYQGAGLGLAIVKRLINEMQGTIGVTSKINKGSTFICKIPLRLPKDEQTYKSINTTKKMADKITQMPKLNILLIEDDDICQLSQKILLSELGYNVDTADSGKQTLELISKHYDIIISDIGLPDIDGYQLAEKIRNSENNPNTPIIALTAHVTKEHKQKCLDHGINVVLHKPMELSEIQQVISALYNGLH